MQRRDKKGLEEHYKESNRNILILNMNKGRFISFFCLLVVSVVSKDHHKDAEIFAYQSATNNKHLYYIHINKIKLLQLIMKN